MLFYVWWSFLPAVVLAHLTFSFWMVMNNVLQTGFPTKTTIRRWVHVSGFLVAVLSSALGLLLFTVKIYVPWLFAVGGLLFALNGASGLVLIPTFPHRWPIWRRLLAIGGIFNVNGGVAACLFLYPSYTLHLIHKISMSVLFVVCALNCGLNILAKVIPSTNVTAPPPMVKSVPAQVFDFFFARGQLPSKDFQLHICGVHIGMVLTLGYVSLFWPFLDDFRAWEALSIETRITGSALLLISVWDNSLSVLGPTLMYRGKMDRFWGFMMYNLFAAPIPQLASIVILFHPTTFGVAYEGTVERLRPVCGPVLWALNPPEVSLRPNATDFIRFDSMVAG